MIFGNKCKDSVVTIGNSIIKESDHEKLLGVTFDKKLSFTQQVEDLCKKANQKLHALARLSNYTDPVKLKLLMDAFINSQFNYCPLVWMFQDIGAARESANAKKMDVPGISLESLQKERYSSSNFAKGSECMFLIAQHIQS